MIEATKLSTTAPVAVQGPPASPPDALPTLPRPEVGHHFPDRHAAWARARELDANVLAVARRTLAEAYERIARLRHELRNPLPGQRCTANEPTALVLDELLSGLLDADGNSVGFALGQADEALE